jgi:hypothetical protein
MAQLPADRTKLNAAIQNQQPSIVADAIANREALVEAYDTIDLLNQKVDTAISNGKMGNEISSDVDMRGYRIRNLAAPTSNTDAARKAEVDGKVSKSGDTMSGPLTMNPQSAGPNAYSQPIFMKFVDPSGVERTAYIQMHPDGYPFINDGTPGEKRIWHEGNNIFSLTFSGGYLKLANELIFQWGATILADGGSVVFPITFPRECLIILPIAKTNAKVWTENETVSGFTLRHDQGANPVPMSYFAIGW